MSNTPLYKLYRQQASFCVGFHQPGVVIHTVLYDTSVFIFDELVIQNLKISKISVILTHRTRISKNTCFPTSYLSYSIISLRLFKQ
jgi:hypothetical protein